MDTQIVIQGDIEAVIAKHTDTFPVPVGEIAKELGIEIISTHELHSDLSGSITKESGQYFIYVNATHPPLRQRFTIAHELGHYVKHRDYLDANHEIKNPSKKALQLQRPTAGSSSVKDDTLRQYEYEANQYAADLLMPEKKFREVWSESDTLDAIITRFGVSAEAANVRSTKLCLGYFE